MNWALKITAGTVLLLGAGCEQTWLSKDLLDDYDNDGASTSVDCNDFDGSIHPEAPEICDGIDNNCNGFIDDDDPLRELSESAPVFFKDRDADGFGDANEATQACVLPPEHAENGTDCDDLDPNLGAPTTWYPDDDGDRFGDRDNLGTESCQQPDTDWVASGGDCNDEDPTINPGVQEGNCNGDVDENALDYNCDGQVGYQDSDEDSYPACNDCNDNDPTIHPDAVEICDGLDNDCSGIPDDALNDRSLLWFPDRDEDGYIVEDENLSIYNCHWYPGWATNGEPDCDDFNAEIGPPSAWYADTDGDSYGAESSNPAFSCEPPPNMSGTDTDCDDSNADIHPGAPEVCGNTVDENCDGGIEQEDLDGDGYQACVDDCNDADATINPSGQEVCDQVDNDCDGLIDNAANNTLSWFVDTDGDGFGEAGGTAIEACNQPSGYVGNNQDCADTTETVHPYITEVCDGIDNNCNGLVDEDDPTLDPALLTAFYIDSDGDGFGDATIQMDMCFQPSGWVADNSDCYDSDATVHPTALELCDGLDNDCDSAVDPTELDTDLDGYVSCELDAGGWDDPSQAPTLGYGDCDDDDAAVSPAEPEHCATEYDDNCDGQANEATAEDAQTFYADTDADGFGDPASSINACTMPTGYSVDNTDCDDTSSSIHPNAYEVCDADDTDEDCNGLADDDDPNPQGMTEYWPDTDSDGQGNVDTPPIIQCNEPSGHVDSNTDCNDTDPTIYDGAPEICDGQVNHCGSSLDANEQDTDSDGYVPCTIDIGGWDGTNTSMQGDDCNDADGALYQWLDGYTDADADGYSDPLDASAVCSGSSLPSGYAVSSSGLDCNDSSSLATPANTTETDCTDGFDNDCDGNIDHTDIDCGTLVKSVAANSYCYCTLDLLGEITCVCGHGGYDLSRPSPATNYVAIPPGSFKEISMASEVACGIDNGAGQIHCWGNSHSTGVNTSILNHYPTAYGFKTITVGETHACAADFLGGVTCWGECDRSSTHCGAVPGTESTLCSGSSFNSGNCGWLDSTTWSNKEIQDLAVSTDVTCVVGQDRTTLNSSVDCFGSGTASSPSGPDHSNYSSLDFLSDGGSDGCGLVTGSPYSSDADCWPPNFNVPSQTSYQPDPSGDGSITSDAIDCGYEGCCAISSDDEMVCWDIPGVVEKETGPYRSVAAGYGFACGVSSDNQLRCQGSAPVP